MVDIQVKEYRRPIGNHSELTPRDELPAGFLSLEGLYDVILEENLDVKKILWQLKRCCRELSIDVTEDINNLNDSIPPTPDPDTDIRVITNQVGGTNPTYDAVTGSIDGVNKIFTVAEGSYDVNTLSVYLNGQLQTQGASNDWIPINPDAGTFEFVTAPSSPDEITVVYREDVIEDTVASDYNIEDSNNTLSGAINGSNKVFTTFKTYISGTLRVWLNGQLQTQGSSEDWAETTTTTFTLTLAPFSPDVVSVLYQSVGSTDEEEIDQTGGTSDTYGTVTGRIDGSNTKYVVGKRNYKTATLRLYLGGQLQTQGDNEDWQEFSANTGVVEFTTAPSSPDEVTAIYQATDALDHEHYEGDVDTTSNYTVTVNDGLVSADATAGGITIALPALSDARGLAFSVGKTDSSVNTVTVDPDGAETINGDSTLVINFQNSWAFIKAGQSEWVVS